MNVINVNLSKEIEDQISSKILPLNAKSSSTVLILIELKDLSSPSLLELRKNIQLYDAAKIVIVSEDPTISLFAWKINAFHFLLKPISSKSITMLSQKINDITKSRTNTKIKILIKGGFEIIEINDITLIKGKGDYCNIYVRGKNPILIAKRIVKFKELLIQYPGFEILNKSMVININHISKVIANEAFFHTLPNFKLQLSPTSITEIKRKLLWFE